MDPHAFLESLAPSTMKFGLDRMRAADAALGQPWRKYRSLHVAGTNGKGSTCAFSEAILREAGLSVGLYTSPHLERVNERIRINGRDISDGELQLCIEAVCQAYPPAADPKHDDTLTYFEFLTAAALWSFARHKVDVAIIEVGLGGRLDATNVITPTACAITTIGFDHTEYLGDTLAKIAAEKAGILKPGVPAAVLTREPEALGAIERVAKDVGAPLKLAGRDFDLVEGVQLALAGDHQRGNAALAVQAVSLLQPVSDEQVRAGLASARWPGRLERLNGVLLDGAHNAEGARALAIYLDSLHKPVHLVFGALGDKDVAAMVDALAPRAAHAYLVKPDSPRALDPDRYLAQVREKCPAEAQPDLASAIAAARAAAGERGQVVVAGSLYLVGPARRILSNELGAAQHAS
jgi:dihydrofolate synthase/folylpolyglutamate synthase